MKPEALKKANIDNLCNYWKGLGSACSPSSTRGPVNTSNDWPFRAWWDYDFLPNTEQLESLVSSTGFRKTIHDPQLQQYPPLNPVGNNAREAIMAWASTFGGSPDFLESIEDQVEPEGEVMQAVMMTGDDLL